MIRELGYRNQFVNWVMECINIISYSILINGKPIVPFQARKRLSQGDPMSSFLFVLGMEYLSRSLNKLYEHLDFEFHLKCKRVGLTYIMFADDALLFYKGELKSIQALMEIFKGSPKPLDCKSI